MVPRCNRHGKLDRKIRREGTRHVTEYTCPICGDLWLNPPGMIR